MNALEFLRSVHRKVSELFEMVERVKSFDDKKRLFREIKRELAAHARIEEGIFFPAIEGNPDVQRQLEDSYKQHTHVRVLLRGIDDLLSENKPCDHALAILKDTVRAANEREETDIFPQVERALNDEALERLARQFYAALAEPAD
ncbi:MAG TPA: hemerythrin domain-containing protein [Candidatus Binatia bacterium]